MFTGIVEEVGTVREVAPLANGLRIVIAANQVTEGLGLGDSVSVDGVCQTVVDRDAESFAMVAIGTTLSRTTLGSFRPGRRVNLERALSFGDRLGGHLVQGHVDGIAEVLSIEHPGDHRLIDLRVPEIVAEVNVPHGSIAVNGVSMTINAVSSPDAVQIAVIPFTWEHTTLSDLAPGDSVNVEGDMLGRFVVGYLKRTRMFGVKAG